MPAQPGEPSGTGPGGPSQPGGYLRVYFSCANAYTRAQRTPEGDAYLARCPTCGQTKRFLIGPGGTSSRSFMLTCR